MDCFIVIVLLVFHVSYSVDHSKFKSCKDSGFCRRLKEFPSNKKRFSLLSGSTTCKSGVFEANFRDNDYAAFESRIKVGVYALKEGIVRIKVTQPGAPFKRLDVYSDILNATVPDIDTSKEAIFDSKHCSIAISAREKVEFNLETASLFITRDDEPVFSFNEEGFLKMEPFLSSSSSPINPDDNVTFETENFGGFTDTLYRGHQGVKFETIFYNSAGLYGFPEHTEPFSIDMKDPEPFRFYNLDVFEYELESRMALYGSVPYLISHGAKGSLGFFYNNVAETWAYPKRVTISEYFIFQKPSENSKMTFASESGIVDIFIMMGPTPKDISRQLARVTGFQAFPPISAIGYHQCRWNYQSQKELLDILNKFEEHNLPVDILWLDIEHTDRKMYFTWDKRQFPTPLEMIDEISSKGRRLVTIVDPHIKVQKDYFIYAHAESNDGYILSHKDKKFDGWCWPGQSVYLDFFNPGVSNWFSQQFKFENYKESSLNVYTWIDMNEPSVFNGPEVTLPKNILHHGDWEHRDLHNAYGYKYHEIVFNGHLARSDGKERPFVLTRAFYAGSQKFGAVWTGDNFARWDHLRASIPMLLSLSVSGIHFVGSDIAGFFGNPGSDLLVRWYQAASFVPFMRAHAHIDTDYREPWLFGEEPLKIIKETLERRYSYLPYIYYIFYESHTSGLPIMRPLWYEFPDDTNTFHLEESFLVGNALLIAPILDETPLDPRVYLPGNDSDIWYDTKTYDAHAGGSWIPLNSSLHELAVFQHGGTIVPRWMRLRRSSSAMLKDPITLVVALNKSEEASGHFYIDDGRTNDFENLREHLLVKVTFKHSRLETTILNSPTNFKAVNHIERVVIISKSKTVFSHAKLVQDRSTLKNLSLLHVSSGPTNILIVRNPKALLLKSFTITLS